MDREISPPRNPVGCARLSQHIQNATEKPSSGPFADDCPTTLPHNGALHLGLSHSSYSANRQNSVYTNRLHNVRTHFVVAS